MAKKKVVEAAASKALLQDFDIILRPVITEKSMRLLQDENKVTLKVAKTANKIQIRDAFERIFGVDATRIQIVNQVSKSTTRGGRYSGTIQGFKKAIITVKDGEAIDLYKD